MADTTITEALAEIKTLGKRVEKKREFVLSALARLEGARDPLEKDGGSVSSVARERQAIKDLQERSVRIRSAISRANIEHTITVENQTRSIADWLVWRREIAPQIKALQQGIRAGLANARNEAKKRDVKLVGPGETAQSFQDILVHVSETELAQEIEILETILGALDGQLSLKNATIVIKVND